MRENSNVLGKYRKVQFFSVPKEKEVIKIDKDGNENIATTSYKIKCVDTSWSNFVHNLTKGIY